MPIPENHKARLPGSIAVQGQQMQSFIWLIFFKCACRPYVYGILLNGGSGSFAHTRVAFQGPCFTKIGARRRIILPKDQSNTCKRDNITGIKNGLACALTIYE